MYFFPTIITLEVILERLLHEFPIFYRTYLIKYLYYVLSFYIYRKLLDIYVCKNIYLI